MPKTRLDNIKKLTNSQIKKLTPYLDDIDPGLTPRQRAFVYYYTVNGFNGAHAAELAGYKPKNAHVTASQNLRKNNIEEALKRILEEVKVDRDLETQFLYERLHAIISADPADFFKPDGTLKFNSWEEIPEELRLCVENVETRYNKECGFYPVIKLIDKKFALDKLDKYVQMTKDSVEHNLGKETQDYFSEKFKDKLDELINNANNKPQ